MIYKVDPEQPPPAKKKKKWWMNYVFLSIFPEIIIINCI